MVTFTKQVWYRVPLGSLYGRRGDASANHGFALSSLSFPQEEHRDTRNDFVGRTRLHAHNPTAWCTTPMTSWIFATAIVTHNASPNRDVQMSVGSSFATNTSGCGDRVLLRGAIVTSHSCLNVSFACSHLSLTAVTESLLSVE